MTLVFLICAQIIYCGGSSNECCSISTHKLLKSMYSRVNHGFAIYKGVLITRACWHHALSGVGVKHRRSEVEDNLQHA